VATCRFKSTEFFNSYPYAYKGSKAHKLLLAKYPDATVIPFTALNLEPYILTHGSRLVCSGLDNSCYDVSSYIALQVSYFPENLNKYASMKLKATILNSSPIDLVIGRNSIRKHNLFTEIPSQLVARPTMSKVTSLPVPACCKDSGSTCDCQPKGRSLLPDGSPKGRFSSQRADLAVSETQGILGVLVDNSENILGRAAADVDEIDEASSGTFLPWSSRFFDTDPLSKIHVFGDEVQRKQILDLCEEFRDRFSNELDETPAIVPPFDLKVDETKWKVRANRAPPRPQTPAN
jgi:hypothetical protein